VPKPLVRLRDLSGVPISPHPPLGIRAELQAAEENSLRRKFSLDQMIRKNVTLTPNRNGPMFQIFDTSGL
jgi:hypothetical protein